MSGGGLAHAPARLPAGYGAVARPAARRLAPPPSLPAALCAPRSCAWSRPAVSSPDTPWDLAHQVDRSLPSARTAHARCNQNEASRRGWCARPARRLSAGQRSGTVRSRSPSRLSLCLSAFLAVAVPARTVSTASPGVDAVPCTGTAFVWQICSSRRAPPHRGDASRVVCGERRHASGFRGRCPSSIGATFCVIARTSSVPDPFEQHQAAPLTPHVHRPLSRTWHG